MVTKHWCIKPEADQQTPYIKFQWSSFFSTTIASTQYTASTQGSHQVNDRIFRRGPYIHIAIIMNNPECSNLPLWTSNPSGLFQSARHCHLLARLALGHPRRCQWEPKALPIVARAQCPTLRRNLQTRIHIYLALSRWTSPFHLWRASWMTDGKHKPVVTTSPCAQPIISIR